MGCIISIHEYYRKKAKIFEQEGKFELAKEYYINSINTGSLIALLDYGIFCISNNTDIEDAGKYLLLAVQKEVKTAYCTYGVYCRYYLKDIEKAKKYLTMAMNYKKSAGAFYHMGRIYEFVYKDYEVAKDLYLQALQQGCVNAQEYYNNLAKGCKNKCDCLNIKNVCICNITDENNRNDIDIIESLKIDKKYCKLFYKLYYQLESSISSCHIRILWNLVDKETQYRFNRIKHSITVLEECPVCYNENVKAIDMECCNKHYICIECIDNVHKCPFGCSGGDV